METVSLIEGMNYSVEQPEQRSPIHLITIEIASRLQEMDDIDGGDEDRSPAGIQLIQSLANIERRSPRAYRLVIDMLSQQRSLSESLDSLGSGHLNKKNKPSSRQSWFQNAREDARIISSVFPQIGEAMLEVLKRRSTTFPELARSITSPESTEDS
jgi:hypothetical protein